MTRKVPKPTLQRLPAYLHLLRKLKLAGNSTVSCNYLAEELKMNPVSVRKDIAAVSSSGGRPKIGYDLETLILDVERYLGYTGLHRTVLVGVGHLGSALLAYPGFSAYGIEIETAFDSDERLIGTTVAGKPVYSSTEISSVCRERNIKIGIITVPSASAQETCNALVAGGVRGVWCFAPVHLDVPDNVLVQREDMAVPLAMLSKHIDDQYAKENAHVSE